MSCCTHCGKTTAATGGEKPKSCGKCRDVTYCGVECQKADWDTHKTSCKPCNFYIMHRVITLHKSQQWRKLIKWNPYIEEHVFVDMRRLDDPLVYTQLLKLHYMFVDAYKLGITSTNDPDDVYALAAVALLDEMVELQGKLNLFSGQGSSLCDLAQMQSRILGRCNMVSFNHYKKASEIATRHGLSLVKSRADLGIGQACNYAHQYAEAEQLFRSALDSAALGSDKFEVCCCYQLIEVLFKLNSIEEAETFIQRCPRLIRQAVGPDFQGLTPMHLKYHIHSARVHDVRGETAETESEVRKMIALVHENKAAIHDWRPTFLGILEDASKQLKILHPKTGNKILVKAMKELAHTKRGDGE
jgi:tetratricopeptide (TPR) repeat protein